MTATTDQRFPILFTGVNKAMRWIGIGSTHSYVAVTPERVRVRLAWSFALDSDRSAVRSAERDHDPVRGWGAHGWRGRWLVNGSSQRLVRITFDPPARGRVLVFPLRVHTLRVSVTNPVGVLAALTQP